MIDKVIYYGEDGVVGLTLTGISMHVFSRVAVAAYPASTFGLTVAPESIYVLNVLMTGMLALFAWCLCAFDIFIYRRQMMKQLAYCTAGIMTLGFSHYLLLSSSPHADQLLQLCAGLALIPCGALLCALGVWVWKNESLTGE